MTMDLRTQMRYLNCYELHKVLVNEYILKNSGDTKLFKRDSSRDRTDFHVIRDNHKFLWNENDKTETWEQQFAKKYYEKLFKEYCIADLSFYKENKIALRWRTETEVVVGKGQFICGNKRCSEKDDLRSWEVNFVYKEKGEKKNALVKLRICPACSIKLNYHTKRREIKRLKNKNKSKEPSKPKDESKSLIKEDDKVENASDNITNPSTSNINTDHNNSLLKDSWEQQKIVEEKSREDEMEEYLQDLLL